MHFEFQIRFLFAAVVLWLLICGQLNELLWNFFLWKRCAIRARKRHEIIPALVCSSTLIRSRPRNRRNKNETKLNHLVILMAGFWTNHMVPFLIIREEFQCWPRIQWLHAICFKWPTTMAKTINNEQKRTGFGIITINPSKGRLIHRFAWI